MEFITSQYQDCIDFLNDCSQVCNECIQSCIVSPDLNKRGELIKSLIDCAEHCQLTVGFLARKSLHSEEMAKISAHLAKVCASVCEKFQDEETKLAGQVCLEAASICINAFDKEREEDE